MEARWLGQSIWRSESARQMRMEREARTSDVPMVERIADSAGGDLDVAYLVRVDGNFSRSTEQGATS